MLLNYLRKYKLTFENPVIEDDPNLVKLSQEASILAPNADLTTTTVLGTVIEDFHMEAAIAYDPTTTSSNSNATTIKVFNLSSNILNRITKLNGRVILEAGYEEGNFDVVFTGQVDDISTVKQGADIVTIVSCKDGWTPVSHIRISKSYGANTTSSRPNTMSDVFEDLISTFEQHGISRSDTGILLSEPNPPWAIPSDVVLNKSWSYSGFLRGAMDKLCQEFGLTYQIEHSTLFIYPKSYTQMFTEVILTEEQILSIRKSAKSNNKTANSVGNSSGVEIHTLLIPQLTPKYRVVVKKTEDQEVASVFDLAEYEGEYKITGMRHQLSYEGSSWNTIIQCEAINDSPV